MLLPWAGGEEAPEKDKAAGRLLLVTEGGHGYGRFSQPREPESQPTRGREGVNEDSGWHSSQTLLT